jgi:DNA-binding FrmR family transcriptional regulator
MWIDGHAAYRVPHPFIGAGRGVIVSVRVIATIVVVHKRACRMGWLNTLRGYQLTDIPLEGIRQGMSEHHKGASLKRLSRIEGQVRGLARMVEEDRYCIDIVTQISAVRAALRRVEEEILREHIAHCVEHAIESGNAAEQRKKVAELMEVLGRSAR